VFPLPFETFHPVRLDPGLEPLQRCRRAARTTAYFSPSASTVEKIVQAGVRDLRRSPAGIGGKIVNDLHVADEVHDVPEIGHRMFRLNDDKYDLISLAAF
jgi:hypothetical protein